MVRPTFEYENKPVKAAGLLVWTESKGKKWTLFRKYKGKWSDMGGKTDAVDNNIIDTVVREVCEETNNSLFCKDDKDCASKVRDMLAASLHGNKMVYVPKCKYLLFHCRCDDIFDLSLSRFGVAEQKLAHQYGWFTAPPRPIHFRLRALRDDLINP